MKKVERDTSDLVLMVTLITQNIKTMQESIDMICDTLQKRIGANLEGLQQDSGPSTTSGSIKPKRKPSSKSKKNTLVELDAIQTGEVGQEESNRSE